MNKLLILLSCLAAGIFTGCNTASQKMDTPVFYQGTNGAIAFAMRTTDINVRNYMSGKQTIDTINAQNGTVQQAGAKGMSQENDALNVLAKGMVALANSQAAKTAVNMLAPGAGALLPSGTNETPEDLQTQLNAVQGQVRSQAGTVTPEVAASKTGQTRFAKVAPTNHITWATSFADAKAAARTNRLIFLLAGTDTCGNCQYVKNSVCETPLVRGVLDAAYVPCYIGFDHGGVVPWEPKADYGLPLWAMVDPATGKYVFWSNGPVGAPALANYLKWALETK